MGNTKKLRQKLKIRPKTSKMTKNHKNNWLSRRNTPNCTHWTTQHNLYTVFHTKACTPWFWSCIHPNNCLQNLVPFFDHIHCKDRTLPDFQHNFCIARRNIVRHRYTSLRTSIYARIRGPCKARKNCSKNKSPIFVGPGGANFQFRTPSK